MKNKIIAMLALSVFLTACNDTNPLNQKPADEAARLLISASESASGQIGLSPAASGDNYRKCMEGSLARKTCDKLMAAMAQSLHQKGINVRPAQVADTALYKKTAARLEHLSWLME